ncbi:hypothetical protein L370_03412 [Enterobacter sp. MGH 24]|uniref:hypothetical protein n=1 Tax=Enterobacter sp. MGH 24 TaxID=1329828 RepID=UPI0003BF4886|nr:hypothetical protein [Enterobacter sp. MGH 24]ESN13135.1 hypothetical protein L370_03412 [Enterobacter sp. MGH 24]MCK7356111.1 hypothetical protein [Enterobacter roggenkampii]
MNVNDFKTVVSTSFSILSSAISQLRSVKSDPFLQLESSNRANTLEKLRTQISTINKYSFVHYPELYTSEEKSDLNEIIITIGNYLSIIQSSIFDDTAHERIESLSESLIKYVRIAQLIKETDQNERIAVTFENKVKEELTKILKLKNDVEINLSKAQDIYSNSTETHETIINLVNELKKEQSVASKKGHDLNQLLVKSSSTYSNIESIHDALNTAKITLDDLYEKSKKLQNELSHFTEESKEEVKHIIKKTDEINKLNETITSQKQAAKELIDNAKAAMNLAGTYRLSRHFKTAYELAKSNSSFWATTSIISALGCIIFVIYILYEMNKVADTTGIGQGSHLMMLFIARLSMIPIMIGFFAFSAIQYVKQNNISEDYAHKKLLSETLISFKQEIGNNKSEKVSEFMDHILKNILNSPLNSNDKKSHREETKSINNLITASMQINKEILDRVLPDESKEKNSIKDNDKNNVK